MGVLGADQLGAVFYALAAWLPGDTHVSPTTGTDWRDVLNGKQR